MTSKLARIVLSFFVSLVLVGVPTVGHAQTAAEQLAALAGHVDVALAHLDAGDVDAARAEYQAFDEGWTEIEDGIRAQSRDSYRAIEDAMADAVSALRADPVDLDRARGALQLLRERCRAFISG